MKHKATTLFLAATVFACAVVQSPALRAAPATSQPANVAPDPAIAALIDQLADAKSTVREEATTKLLKMGKGIVPALKPSADADDPELRARVRTIIRKLERRIPPSAPAARPGFQQQSMRASVSNGQKTINVNDNGHKIHIEQKGDAIKMSVTGVDEDGQEATEMYEAASPDELKDQTPEVYALYEKWGGGGANGTVIINGGAGGQIRLHAGQLRIGVGGGNAPATQPATQPAGGAGAGAAADNADRDVREMIRRQVQQGNLPAEAQEQILRQLEDVDRMRREAAEHARQVRELRDDERGPRVEQRPAPPAPQPVAPLGNRIESAIEVAPDAEIP